MINFNENEQREPAIRVPSNAQPEQREALRLWVKQLLEIKSSTHLTPVEKEKQAIKRTADKQVITPL